jgi:hypothetical protein
MTSAVEIAFVGGMVAMGHLIASLFFLRFWARTSDKLFLAFSIAFGLMSLNQALVVILNVPREEQSVFYLLRLAAFLLIIVAIVGKNVSSRRR